MIHAVTAVLLGALNLVLMVLVVAASVLVVAGGVGLLLGLASVLFGGPGAWSDVVEEVLWPIRRSPRTLRRVGVWFGLRIVSRLPGPRRWHAWLAKHPRAAQSTHSRLVRRRRVTPEMLHAVFVSNSTTEPVRIDVVLRCDDFGGVTQVLPEEVRGLRDLPYSQALAYAWPLTYADDAVVVQDALRLHLHDQAAYLMRRGYARLARLAGPEAVWALELERAGSLDDMDSVVRASMLSGETDEILEWLERRY